MESAPRGKYLDLSFAAVLPEIFSDPFLLLIIILNIGVIIVNGATDASNAISTCVGTRALSPGKAIGMAAVGNFLGVSIMTFISTAVADTIFKMVDFGDNSHIALIAVAAAMVAIIVWGCAAWFFGIPTSQSHSLIAGLTGAAIAVMNGFSGINWSEWMKVIYGLVISVILGFGLGWLFTKITGKLCEWVDYRRSQTTFRYLQIAAAAFMSFMHGAQDGQKFMSITMLGVILSLGGSQSDMVSFPFWMMVLCAGSMALGTGIGGKRIIKNVGMDMVKLEKWQGFAADMAAAFSLLFATLTGLPVSTTHTKTTAIMGVGTAKRASAVNWGVAKDMVWTWILTFPGCGLIGYLLAELFFAIF